MQIECPRCHFKQPNDQYCANCGVDIISFKPAEKSAMTSFMGSGFFQFFLIAGVVFLASYFLVKASRPQQWIQKVNRFASTNLSSKNPTPQTSPSSLNTATAPTPQNLDTQKTETPPPPAIQTAARADSPVNTARALPGSENSNPTASLNGTTPGQNTNTDDQNKKSVIYLQLIEINTDYALRLIQIMQSNQTLVMDADLKAGVLQDTTKVDSQNFKILKTEDLSSTLSKGSSRLFTNNYTKFDATHENEKGLKISISIDGKTEKGTVLKATLTKLIASDPFELPFELNLKKNEKFFITGTPLLSYFETESELADTVPFRIFKSADFKNQKSTFAILIDVRD